MERLDSLTYHISRFRPTVKKAGKGNRKVCCRLFGSADGLMSRSLMNIKSSKRMTRGLLSTAKDWRLCWHHALILPIKLQNCKQRGKKWR
jgi:hypothetical protein